MFTALLNGKYIFLNFDILSAAKSSEGLMVFADLEVFGDLMFLRVPGYTKPANVEDKEMELEICPGNGTDTDNTGILTGLALIRVGGPPAEPAPPPPTPPPLPPPPPPPPPPCRDCRSDCGCYRYEETGHVCHFMWNQGLTKEESELFVY